MFFSACAAKAGTFKTFLKDPSGYCVENKTVELEEAGGQSQAGAISQARGTEGWITGRMAAVEVAVFTISFQAGAQRTYSKSERKRDEG